MLLIRHLETSSHHSDLNRDQCILHGQMAVVINEEVEVPEEQATEQKQPAKKKRRTTPAAASETVASSDSAAAAAAGAPNRAAPTTPPGPPPAQPPLSTAEADHRVAQVAAKAAIEALQMAQSAASSSSASFGSVLPPPPVPPQVPTAFGGSPQVLPPLSSSLAYQPTVDRLRASLLRGQAAMMQAQQLSMAAAKSFGEQSSELGRLLAELP